MSKNANRKRPVEICAPNGERSMTVLSAAVEEIRKNQAMKSNEQNPDFERRLLNVEKENYATQQYSRRDTLEIAGIPQSIEDSELEKKACDLFGEIGVPITPSQIQACHRLYDRKRVIIKFQNRKSSYQILQSRKNLKEINLADIGIVTDRIYINESLCPHYRMLPRQA